MTLLDARLPEWHFRERHSIEVDAPSERIYAAARETSPLDAPAIHLLFRLRGLRMEWPPREFQILAEEAGREVVIGSIGRPWKLREWPRAVECADFPSFADPGYAKMAMNLFVEGRTLSTETRVLLTDGGSRRAFRRYWLVIRPFSGLIRRLWLRAIKRRAEA
jgi:hypothetical protein